MLALAGLALLTAGAPAQARDVKAPSTPKGLVAKENGAPNQVRKTRKHARGCQRGTKRKAARHHRKAKRQRRKTNAAARCKGVRRPAAHRSSAPANGGDRNSPTPPAKVVAGAGAQQVALSWKASNDNVGVVGYDVYSTDVKVGSVADTSTTVAGLACGTTYSFAVDAYDAAGNHSKESAPVAVSTAACGSGSGGSDGSAPTSPTGLQAPSVATTSLNLAWSGSTDNVGVAGYDVFNGGNAIAKTTSTSTTVSGLNCGTSYSFAVDAFDAAGNHSPQSPPLTVATNPCPTQPTPSPSTPSIYWGAWMGGNAFGSGYSDAPWDTNTWSRFESDAGKPASIVHFGNSWQSGGTYQSFPQGTLEQVRQHGAIPMLDWGTWNLGASDQSAFQLADIINGNHDSYIRSWATAAKNWGHPFFLRMDWEMNGNWFPWGEGTNGNSSGQYAAMWRHVHDIFTSVGATNVTWVWCPNTVWSGATPLSGLYPGDAYVDWVGLDGYNWSSVKGNPWQSFSSVIGATYTQLSSLAPTKPIMIGETGSVESGGSKASWLTDMLNVLPTSFPKVKALVYFNKADDGAVWPIQSSAGAKTAFAGAIASPYYAPGGGFTDLPLLTTVKPM